MQERNCEEYIIPFIEEVYPLKSGFRVLEIGCGTAGVLSAFLKREGWGVGVDFDENSLRYGERKLTKYVESGQLKLLSKDIYRVDPETEFNGKFDVIVLKDVIEHIHDQEKLITWMKSFLNPGGVIFFGFPPWQMPFGGHQQMCKNKILAHFPYLHLLPMPLYKSILSVFKEGAESLGEIKETGISIERFEKTAKTAGYKIINTCHYFINPIYKYKFNLKVRKQSAIIQSIPYLRNFFTTSVFYLLQAN
jgi:2-polyprenyl-3-methyl-5-hydroxy-6-metoxy-1,4-benzoquinol methylase